MTSQNGAYLFVEGRGSRVEGRGYHVEGNFLFQFFYKENACGVVVVVV